MTSPAQRHRALSRVRAILADAAQLRELIENARDVRTGEMPGSDTWPTDIERAQESLRRALAQVSRYAVL